MVENPRWLRRVLCTVGLIGQGDIGVRGRGDLVRVAGVVVGTVSMSLGLAARASILEAISQLRRRRYRLWEACGGLLEDVTIME